MNLTEAWKEGYAIYLKEEEERFNEDFEKTMDELVSLSENSKKSIDILETYYMAFAESEGLEEALIPRGKVGDTIESTDDGKGKLSKTIADLLGSINDKEDLGLKNYAPSAVFTYQKLSDMKFPGNLIFFITQIAKWIRNVVIYLIEKFKNLLRRIVGEKPNILNPAALKLDLKKARSIEQIATGIDLGKTSSDVVKAWSMDSDKIERVLMEGYGDDDDEYTPVRNKSFAQFLKIDTGKKMSDPVRKTPVVVTLDFSRDIIQLKELMQHFFDLYDNAYGSRNENLFGTDDLELIFKIFEDTIKRVQSGDIAQYSVQGGNAIQVAGINSDRIKDNLILTNENINNLKKAYVDTSARIKEISRVINSKEMLMLSDLGISYACLSSTSLVEMNGINSILPDRINKANAMAKDLDTMQKKYQAMTDELKKLQKSILAISNVTYDTVYNKQIVDLLNSARYMTDITTLRLSGLGLYIKELKDIRDILTLISGVAAQYNH